MSEHSKAAGTIFRSVRYIAVALALAIVAAAVVTLFIGPRWLLRDEEAHLRAAVAKIGSENLLRDRAVLEEHTSQLYGRLPKDIRLPPSFRQLDPLYVVRQDVAFLIVTRQGFGAHKIGILLLPKNVPQPSDAGTLTTKRIAPGVYYYIE